MEIVGVEIKPLNRETLFGQLAITLSDDRPSFQHAVTINPEFIVEAQQNAEFRQVLNEATYTLVDGIGLLGAIHFKLRTQNLEQGSELQDFIQFVVSCVDVGLLRQKVVMDSVEVERIGGVDFVQELVSKDWMSGKRVFLLGGKNDVAQRAAQKLKVRTSGVEFGHSNGHANRESMTQEEDAQMLAAINEFRPDVLLVAYGHPWQDMWIHRVKEQLSSVRLAMGVGGAFDYISGEVERAPQWMQNVGIEWLYRVFKQPERFERIMNATWRFARLVVREK